MQSVFGQILVRAITVVIGTVTCLSVQAHWKELRITVIACDVFERDMPKGIYCLFELHRISPYLVELALVLGTVIPAVASILYCVFEAKIHGATLTLRSVLVIQCILAFALYINTVMQGLHAESVLMLRLSPPDYLIELSMIGLWLLWIATEIALKVRRRKERVHGAHDADQINSLS